MPTPSEAALPPSPQSDIVMRTTFTSCPPEEDREDQSSEHGSGTTVADEHAISQQPTPEPEERAIASSSGIGECALRSEHIEDIGSSPCESGSADAVVDAIQSIPATISSSEYAYGHGRNPLGTTVTSSFLRPGSKFRGMQKSDRQKYDVQVEIKDVNMAESFLCGYLRIQGLTDDHPTLTTFFEGEIIGTKYLFKTDNPTWGSSEKVDLQHWGRFPAWRPLAKSAKSPNFTLKNYQQREHLFMRWKEYFLVPDHRVKTITGASFEGFYYICFNQCDGQISGIYFHAKSEKYQQLELQHVDDHGCMGAFEFR